MKKFFAVFFAVMFALSVCGIAYAEDASTHDADIESYPYVCDYCGAAFKAPESLKAHIDETFPIYASDELAAHEKVCTTLIIADDGTVAQCGKHFTTKAAYEAHSHNAPADFDLLKGYIKMGDILSALKILFNIIKDFVTSDTFKGIIDKVVGVVKGIDFSSIIGKVKDIAGKIPFDTIVDTVKGLA